MEVRDFVNEEVTVFKENGLTPAAETLVHEEFLLEDEAILEAYHNACDELAEEIEILFDRSSAYSLLDPDDDTFEELCGMLDEVSDEVWRADDVLGWVYEYYTTRNCSTTCAKRVTVLVSTQRMSHQRTSSTRPTGSFGCSPTTPSGNSTLEHTGELQDVVETQQDFTPDERKNRPLSPDESPDIADFCTYLVPSEEEGESTDFEHPEELRVIDPACGSGHFLLYAFDVLERIWRTETDLPHEEIPRKILQHNLYGVDLDMRACQLAAFNLYLKGRTRTGAEGADGFDMPRSALSVRTRRSPISTASKRYSTKSPATTRRSRTHYDVSSMPSRRSTDSGVCSTCAERWVTCSKTTAMSGYAAHPRRRPTREPHARASPTQST